MRVRLETADFHFLGLSKPTVLYTDAMFIAACPEKGEPVACIPVIEEAYAISIAETGWV